MASVIFVGTIMGDCEPGPGCHDNDGAILAGPLLVLLLIVIVATGAVWLLCSILQRTLRDLVSPIAMNLFLTVLTLGLLWFGFDPLLKIFFAIAT